MVLPLACLLAACGPNYSPDTYSSNAVQQANKVDSGVVVGVRKVAIRADAAIGTATGGAAGGIAGSQVASGAVSALGALGGAVVGGVVGNSVGHSVDDTFGFEYIVRKANGDLLSVTQKDPTPLQIGQHVLIIQGSQARIVGDYTVPVETASPRASETPPAPITVEPLPKSVSTPPAATSPQSGQQPSSGPTANQASTPPVAASAQPSDQPSSASSTTPTSAPPAATSPQSNAQPSPPSTATPTSSPSATVTPPPGAQPPSSSTTAASDPAAGAKASDDPQNSQGQPNADPAPVTHGPGAAH
jgi:outer membrane lipoprotein SlyB